MKSDIRTKPTSVPQSCTLRYRRPDAERALDFSGDFAVSAVAFPLTPALSLRERENLPPPRVNSDAQWFSCFLRIERPDGGGETQAHGITSARRSLFPLPEGEGQGEGEEDVRQSRDLAYAETSST